MRQLTITALLLTACTRYTAFTPATAPAPEGAFDKAVRVLVERGESIETKDESAGVIVTGWREEHIMGDSMRLRWTVSLANGVVTVNSQCEAHIDDPGFGQRNNWQTCSGQPEERGEQARQIAESIGR